MFLVFGFRILKREVALEALMNGENVFVLLSALVRVWFSNVHCRWLSPGMKPHHYVYVVVVSFGGLVYNQGFFISVSCIPKFCPVSVLWQLKTIVWLQTGLCEGKTSCALIRYQNEFFFWLYFFLAIDPSVWHFCLYSNWSSKQPLNHFL